ncbi:MULTISPECIES: hypothetical protein [Alteribacter]|uniref:hypothetical protein n=1 Tax=Alteribacter TaxID=2823237 RepID=UPI00160631AE|nr:MULTISPECIES: hypothetical protein [Alteribacter]
MRGKNSFSPLYVIGGACFLAAMAAAHIYDSDLFRAVGRAGLLGLLIVLFFQTKRGK